MAEDDLEDALDEAPEAAANAIPAILDAGAVLAYLKGEIGGEVIKALIEDGERPLYIQAMNACEVNYHFAQAGTPTASDGVPRGTPPAINITNARAAIATIEADGIQVQSAFDRALWEDVAQLKAIWRKVSLADCCGVSLTRRLGGEFFTTDRHELTALEGAGVANITFIR